MLLPIFREDNKKSIHLYVITTHNETLKQTTKEIHNDTYSAKENNAWIKDKEQKNIEKKEKRREEKVTLRSLPYLLCAPAETGVCRGPREVYRPTNVKQQVKSSPRCLSLPLLVEVAASRPVSNSPPAF